MTDIYIIIIYYILSKIIPMIKKKTIFIKRGYLFIGLFLYSGLYAMWGPYVNVWIYIYICAPA